MNWEGGEEKNVTRLKKKTRNEYKLNVFNVLDPML